MAKLAKLENLNVRTFAKTDKRKVGDAIDDPISDKLAKANTPDEMAALATEYGIPADVVEQKAKVAPNFGQFRMTLGNMMRGAIARRERYTTETGQKATYAEVGTKKLFAAKMSEWRKSQKPVKDGSKVKAAKPKDDTKGGKTPTKSKSADEKGGTKRVTGKDGVTRDVVTNGDGEVVSKNVVGGAPSKSDAARRGKGKKPGGKRSQRPAAAATDAGVDVAGSQAGEQEQLAADVAQANA